MDEPTIAGCRAKLDRADAAAHEFNARWMDWVESNPFKSRIERDTDTGEWCLFYDFSEPLVPLLFPVLLGEIVHDLRSTLDHLVWREAVECLGRMPTDQEANGISFPITRSRKKFKSSNVKWFLDDDAWEIIERHQPYDRGKPKRSKALELLHWINRMDKHRFIHGSHVFIAQAVFNTLRLVTWDGNVNLVAAPVADNASGRRLLGEAKIARYLFHPSDVDPELKVVGTPPLSISLGLAPKYIRSLTISQTAAEVRKVVDDFARTVA